MKKEHGLALKEFLRNRDSSGASSDMFKLLRESKTWDTFLLEASNYGFKWSQIYFVKEILELYDCINNNNLKWFLLHLQYQYEVGNLRSSLKTLEEDVKEWLVLDKSPFKLNEFLTEIPNIILSEKKLFGSENQPFLIVGDYIYINRIKKYEERFLELLDIRLKTDSKVGYDFSGVRQYLENNLDYIDESRLDIVKKVLKNSFQIISGGPGTGKTTTIVTIIKALKYIGLENISLAAPTGRAAKRMIESIKDDVDIEAYTLHKLLGIIPNKSRPRYNSTRLLPADVVIVDEASMVDIHMMYRLFDALSPSCKLILVGDKDQLPSVEAGALLGDFLFNYKSSSHRMKDSISVLEKTYRSSKGIMSVAKVVIDGDFESVLELIKNRSDDVTLKPLPDIDSVILEIYYRYKSLGDNSTFNCSVTDYKDVEAVIEDYFLLYSNFTVLTPSKKGLFGTYSINSRLKRLFNPYFAQFYHGEPIMITKNDYINGLFNGDRGVVFAFNNGLYAFFKENSGYKVVSISKIVDYETSYAGTVHKSQGSEFTNVCIIVPEGSEKMLTREILYTALTRAKEKVTLFAMDSEIITAVKKKIKRESGIRDFLNK
ncbi:exodeoxyribonuclease V subunit alpha [Thiospirochaeta perfilievii]|uniref:RecBCD enzyme subunit RecD n=1 Tax=Thiospirochaeta perfilievii TaxID=252967 RepID=A0A5C1QDA9_9SPIO|nr:exodeoxyribonuclease V subunit alpha [Thiospirochaeta perfilievii]QEN04704.1 exodeoxyribonuclease V subunit alpha [Thiospirochaeta perfilievii]